MQPLAAWPALARAGIAGVLTDIDDTLTTEGAITPDALQALAALAQAGLHVVPITGRPVGWSEPFALQWPVDAIVAENGAVALTRNADGTLRKLYTQTAAERAPNFARMQQVAQRIVREVPGATLSRDSGGRETDIAIDHSEFTHLPQDAIDRVVRLMRAEGMNATVSSIHVNGWYGAHDKLAGARWIVRELFGRDLEQELERWVYVGDSTNDVLMFQHFPHSVGVANIRRFEDQLAFKPRYVTRGERGAGFVEVATSLLAARQPATAGPGTPTAP
jgi:HAD superfamily hydrolase (TIGR01484 family)